MIFTFTLDQITPLDFWNCSKTYHTSHQSFLRQLTQGASIISSKAFLYYIFAAKYRLLHASTICHWQPVVFCRSEKRILTWKSQRLLVFWDNNGSLQRQRTEQSMRSRQLKIRPDMRRRIQHTRQRVVGQQRMTKRMTSSFDPIDSLADSLKLLAMVYNTKPCITYPVSQSLELPYWDFVFVCIGKNAKTVSEHWTEI